MTLTALEKMAVDYLLRGEILDLTNDNHVSKDEMVEWGDDRSIRSGVVRDILRGRHASDPDPHGLRLRGLRISGLLDLRNVSTDIDLELKDCYLPDGIDARDAQLLSLVLDWSIVKCGSKCCSEAPINADHMAATHLSLKNSIIYAEEPDSCAVSLEYAHIRRSLHADGAELTGDSGPALNADSLKVDADMSLDNFIAKGSGEEGAVCLRRAHIGYLKASGAHLTNESGPALNAAGLQVDSDLFLREDSEARKDFEAKGRGKNGTVNLHDAHIGGQFDASGVRMVNDRGPALYAAELQVGTDLFLKGTFKSEEDSECDGTVNLLGAHIGGLLDASGAHLTNDSGPALNADNLQVDKRLVLGGGFTARGSGKEGAVRLLGARIGGLLDADGAHLANDSGPALNADNLRVDSNLFLRNDFTAKGSGELGAINLLDARIGGQFDASGAQLKNLSGPALDATSLRVGNNLFLRDAFSAIGHGERGAVRLQGASIGGLIDFTGARIDNRLGPGIDAEAAKVGWILALRNCSVEGVGESGAVCLTNAHIRGEFLTSGCKLSNKSPETGKVVPGPALNAENLKVENDLRLSGTFSAGGDNQTVRLVGAQVDGRLVVDQALVEDKKLRWYLDGLTYAGLPDVGKTGIKGTVGRYMELLQQRMPEYAAQPYQQLAGALKAAGHESEFRQVLMAQRDDQLRRGEVKRFDRLWGRFTGLVLGYGYQPWRALLCMLGFLVVAVTVNLLFGADSTLINRSGLEACTNIERVGVGLGIGLPLPGAVDDTACFVDTGTTAGGVLFLLNWALRLLSGAFAALFVTGLTSAVRKT